MRRRDLLTGSLGAAALAGLARPGRAVAATSPFTEALAAGLVPDPQGLIDLPPGFTYVVLERAGDPTPRGGVVPGQPDGMTCHAGADGTWVLLRNHEMGGASWFRRVAGDPRMRPVDPSGGTDTSPGGGVTRIVLDPETLRAELASPTRPERSASVRDSHAVLQGTSLNCAGGPSAEGWVSCEEDDSDGHGFAYRLRTDDTDLVDRATRRLAAWGRFRREAVAIVPAAGEVYMTEDTAPACVYRFRTALGGDVFTDAGTVEALAIDGVRSVDPVGGSRGPSAVTVGRAYPARWVAVADPSAAREPCRLQALKAGATAFTRPEGMTLTDDGRHVWFVASTGGPVGAGQLFRYDRAAATVTLEAEVGTGGLAAPHARTQLSMPDNLVVGPGGILLLCEDNYATGDGCTAQHVRVRTPDGGLWTLARNAHGARNAARRGANARPGEEFAGACFSPDGRVLFVNLQNPLHLTMAITGPFPTT